MQMQSCAAVAILRSPPMRAVCSLGGPTLTGKNFAPIYSAYFLDEDGHIQMRVDLVCADIGAAEETAKQLVDGHDVELWDGDRKVATFSRED